MQQLSPPNIMSYKFTMVIFSLQNCFNSSIFLGCLVQNLSSCQSIWVHILFFWYLCLWKRTKYILFSLFFENYLMRTLQVHFWPQDVIIEQENVIFNVHLCWRLSWVSQYLWMSNYKNTICLLIFLDRNAFGNHQCLFRTISQERMWNKQSVLEFPFTFFCQQFRWFQIQTQSSSQCKCYTLYCM